MIDDDIILGVRAAREEYARSHNFNIRAIIADLQARDDVGDRIVVRRSARRPVRVLPQQKQSKEVADSGNQETKLFVAAP